MNSEDSFSATYAEAREKFVAAANRSGGQMASIQHPEPGPNGCALTTDVAGFGPRNAERVLVLLSATHGVEGFAGSGAQVDWLTRDEAANLPAGVSVLLIHAPNPYGFAWLRRVTHENVDLNRNWIDFSQPLPDNSGYEELAGRSVPCTGQMKPGMVAIRGSQPTSIAAGRLLGKTRYAERSTGTRTEFSTVGPNPRGDVARRPPSTANISALPPKWPSLISTPAWALGDSEREL